MKVVVFGANGKMGKEVCRLLSDKGDEVFAVDSTLPYCAEEHKFSFLEQISEKCDVIIDFSNHVCTETLCSYAKLTKTPLLIATTGQTDAEKTIIKETANSVAVFNSGNMSLGIVTLCGLIVKSLKVFENAEVEIIETHHNQKLDSPSGTALMLANCVKGLRPNAKIVCGRNGYGKRDKNEIGVNSVRYGSVVGEHEVIISTQNETLTLKHSAHSRLLFADGAVKVAEKLAFLPSGFYNMKDIFNEN